MSENTIPATAVSLLLRAAALQISGGRVLYAAAAGLRAGLDTVSVVTLVCTMLDLSDPDPELVARVLLALPEFPETRKA